MELSSILVGFAAGLVSCILIICLAILYLAGYLRVQGKPPSTQYRPDINIQNVREGIAIRSKLLEFIFANPSLPTSLPKPSANGWSVEMENGFTSLIIKIQPQQPNGALVLYHSGHEGMTFRDHAVIKHLIKAGFEVWKLDLPLIGENSKTIEVVLPGIGQVPIQKHEHFAYLKPITTGDPVRFFIEPVVAAVNLASQKGKHPIFMTGLSGGGWVTTLAAALDERITASYPVAGTAPLGLRFDHHKNWGDWEQWQPALYQIASYEDLYILGAQSRSQIQFLNQYDLCCFDEPRYALYEKPVQTIVDDSGGQFRVVFCRREFIHRMNPAAFKIMLEDMLRIMAHQAAHQYQNPAQDQYNNANQQDRVHTG